MLVMLRVINRQDIFEDDEVSERSAVSLVAPWGGAGCSTLWN